MLLLLLAFIMRFVDISKVQRRQRCPPCDAAGVDCPRTDDNGNSLPCWQYVAAAARNSSSSSTSSGCDSSSSSKENYYAPQQHQQQQQQQRQQQHSNMGLTPQQLQQIRYYQHMQQQQLQLLQQQLLQRRRLQQQLRDQGVVLPKAAAATTTAGLTCNQQYLMQQRLQQQQQQNVNNNNDNDYLNNNNNNRNKSNSNYNRYNNNNNNITQGIKLRRGMTEFSTNIDNNNINSSSSSNINIHHNEHHDTSPTKPQQNSPATHRPYKKTHTPSHPHLLLNLAQQQQQQQQLLPVGGVKQYNGNTAAYNTILASASGPGSAPQSPLHYRKPLNSPNNSLFAAHATTAGKRYQQQQLNDRLLQQQHLKYCQQQQLQQQQQQQLNEDERDASVAAEADELSEESLKQNVAIVLSNLDRYNSALRSIILNEQVSNISSVISNSNSLFLDEDSFIRNSDCVYEPDNNNFVWGSSNQQQTHTMAATNVATPESDYNSNATTPGGRSSEPVQQQQHGVGGMMLCGLNGGGGVPASGGGGGVGGANNLNCSLASSQDFTHDNSDYQWFLDYGYRDCCGGLQRSVLSSLYYDDLAMNLDANLAEADMESFRTEDIHSLLSQLPAYCKSLGGVNSRLQQSLIFQQQQQQHMQQQQQQQQHGNMLCNMQLQQQQLQQQQMAHNMSQTSTTSTNELIDNSFCKSELLFSPVKESHISVDSLDMDAYPDEGDIILTCNKDNYTIAFEGSVLYSDDSFYAEPCDIAARNKQNCINLHSNLEDIVKRNKALEVSMSRSAQSFQLLSQSPSRAPNKAQLQRRSFVLVSPARRYPSGNNNNDGNTTTATATATADTITLTRHMPQCSVRKSNSLPNLQRAIALSDRLQQEQREREQLQQQQLERGEEPSGPLNVSQAISTSTMESCTSRSRNLLPMCQMPISISVSISERLQQAQQQQQQQQSSEQQSKELAQHQHHHQHHSHRHKHRCSCGMSSTQGSQQFCSAQASQAHISGSASSGNSNPAAFNLVKLFIKQKSSSSSSAGPADEPQACALTSMDVSSGCWPSSDAAGSSCSSSSLEKRLRKKSMNDSGKGSAVSRHDDDDGHYDDAEVEAASSTPKRQLRTRCDAVFYDDGASSSSTGSLTATNSPAHRRRSVPLRNPQLYQLAANNTHNAPAGGQQAQSTQCSQHSSEASSEQLTQVPLGGGGKVRRPLSCASSSEMITRSMQTSCGSLSTTRSSLSERYRCVPPSFLAKLHNLGEQREAPIYVIYPNYALPDLGFVKTNTSTDVIFSPFNYKMTLESAATKQRTSSQSLSEPELFKSLDYKHIADWQSLATLLPAEFRHRLQHIPEVRQIASQLDAELSQRPLFCMSPPIRRNRATVCDCAKSLQQQQQTQLDEASSSGSSQPPSSGYRGSSTLLTDSEMDADPLKQMYVYQYEQQRMDSGAEMSPASRQASQTPPHPMPRSILRKANSTQTRAKRNSMIEASKQSQQLSKLEKRRSLQEPPYNYALGSTDELAEVFEEEEQAVAAAAQPQAKQRLSRKDQDARARAENFLASLPRSELKYYAEIASILESSGEQVQYDAAALKKEVSRVLSQQKKVSFNDVAAAATAATAMANGAASECGSKRFSTPPNSPNISVAALQRRETLDAQEQRKIETNRFKRLQIQWELMSKDSSMLKELASEQATKSGGSTPTSTNSTGSNSAQKSRIPRPVSYPAGRSPRPTSANTQPSPARAAVTPTRAAKTVTTKCRNSPANLSPSPQLCRVSGAQDAASSGKCSTRSPSRIVQPKRYSIAGPPSSAAGGTTTTPTSGRARTPTSRTGAAATAPNTPKRQSVAQSSR
ncbi:hypothetical protein KR093_009075 [Drosophila rubida]|uniref:Serine-rich adhesin for platelets n=1 Tax=Drosophila rubida TaxID=30044 RepID=A0AAD4JVU8_9MUSC|nr:hypothetical protein KR093_009075 [Drosophila rubida]